MYSNALSQPTIVAERLVCEYVSTRFIILLRSIRYLEMDRIEFHLVAKRYLFRVISRARHCSLGWKRISSNSTVYSSHELTYFDVILVDFLIVALLTLNSRQVNVI